MVDATRSTQAAASGRADAARGRVRQLSNAQQPNRSSAHASRRPSPTVVRPRANAGDVGVQLAERPAKASPPPADRKTKSRGRKPAVHFAVADDQVRERETERSWSAHGRATASASDSMPKI